MAIPLERCTRLDNRLASIDMSTAYTACIDDPVYMRWREAEAEEWANIQQTCLAPDNTDTDTDPENSNNTFDGVDPMPARLALKPRWQLREPLPPLGA